MYYFSITLITKDDCLILKDIHKNQLICFNALFFYHPTPRGYLLFIIITKDGCLILKDIHKNQLICFTVLFL